MKRLICLLAVAFAITNTYAQNSEQKYIEESKTIVDTALAIKMADEKREELKFKIKDDYVITNNEIRFLTMLSASKKKKVKKEDEIEMLCDIVDRCVDFEKRNKNVVGFQTVFLDKSDIVKNDLHQGKIDPIFYEKLNLIIGFVGAIPSESKIDRMSFEELVSPLPTKTIKVKKPNRNFAYWWIENVDMNSLSFNPLKDAYTSSDYPQYVFKKCKFEYYDDVLVLFDKSGNLITTQMGLYITRAKEEMVNACVKYDYMHNAFDINSESSNLKSCVEAILNAEIPLNNNYLAGNLLTSNMIQTMAKQSYKSGLISFSEYTNILKGTRDAINSKQDEIQKNMAKYDKETITKARRFVQTLKDTNSNLINRNFTVERNGNLEALVTFDKVTFKQLYSYDSNENKIVCSFEVLKK